MFPEHVEGLNVCYPSFATRDDKVAVCLLPRFKRGRAE